MVLGILGSNPDLKPETATHWTVGFDWKPAWEGFSLNANYFDVNFRNRIDQPSALLTAPFSQYPEFEPFVNRRPTAAQVSSALAIVPFNNFYGPFSPSQVTEIFDDTEQNFAKLHVRGVDGHIGKPLHVGSITIDLGVDASYLIGYDEQFGPSAPIIDLTNTVFNPPRLKARAEIGVHAGDLTGAMFVNHTNSYTNNTVVPNQDIASWTTVDVSLIYRGDASSTAWLAGTTLALSVSNLLNRNPPSVTTPSLKEPIGYDPTNADPTGRFVALQLTHSW